MELKIGNVFITQGKKEFQILMPVVEGPFLMGVKTVFLRYYGSSNVSKFIYSVTFWWAFARF